MRAFPMILLAMIAYNALVFGGGAAGMTVDAMLAQAVSLKLVSGDLWKITVSDGFIAAALVTFSGGNWHSVAGYLLADCLLSAATALVMKETHHP